MTFVFSLAAHRESVAKAAQWIVDFHFGRVLRNELGKNRGVRHLVEADVSPWKHGLPAE